VSAAPERQIDNTNPAAARWPLSGSPTPAVPTRRLVTKDNTFGSQPAGQEPARPSRIRCRSNAALDRHHCGRRALSSRQHSSRRRHRRRRQQRHHRAIAVTIDTADPPRHAGLAGLVNRQFRQAAVTRTTPSISPVGPGARTTIAYQVSFNGGAWTGTTAAQAASSTAATSSAPSSRRRRQQRHHRCIAVTIDTADPAAGTLPFVGSPTPAAPTRRR